MPVLPLITPKLEVPDRVAIVGSSPRALSAKLGKEIDAHAMIIRFNRSPHEGFEEYVGSRTDVRYVNSHVFDNKKHPRFAVDQFFMQRVMNTTIVLRCGAADESHYKASLEKTHKSNRLHLLPDTKLEPFLQEHIAYRNVGHPTVGHAMMALLVLSGVQVDAYAFSLDNCMGHYWEQRTNNESPCHKIDGERAIWLKWQEKGLVTFR